MAYTTALHVSWIDYANALILVFLLVKLWLPNGPV
jgi:hypothetical protein